MKKYNASLNKKAGNRNKKSNDDNDFDDNFVIRNNRDSIIIGNSDHGRIAFNGEKLTDGEIRCITVGTSGSGKSYITRNIIEQFYEKNKGIIIVIDPEGEYWTLREKYDFLILGVDEDFCDLMINQDNAQELATNMIKHKVNIIMDLSGIDDRSKQEIASRFIDTIIEDRDESPPIQLFIEEASRFAKKGDASAINIKCTGSLKKTAQFGRKRQLSTFYNTQRITQLHKDIVAECNTKILGRVDDIADVNRLCEIAGIKDGSIFRKLKYEFLAKGVGFDHDETNQSVKFKSEPTHSRHLKSTKRARNSHPKPNDHVKEWIILMGGKLPNELKAILEVENKIEKNLALPEGSEEIKKPISESEDDKIKDIVKYFGKINLNDLYVLLVRDNFTEIAARFEFGIFCKKYPEFKIIEDVIYYIEEDIDSIKITSEMVLKLWKDKLKDFDYSKILTYLYEMNNDRNRISEMEKSLSIRKESIMIACNKFESLNLTKLMNGSIYLNAVLFFDKDTNGENENEDFENSFDDTNEDDDDFFNNDDD